MPTLNTMAPENVAHGSEILLQVQGPSGGYVTIGEIFEMSYDADNKMEHLPVLGTRRTAMRRGRFEVKGSIKAYWLNSTARSIWMGYATPTNAGSGPIIYQSQEAFVRYQMTVINASWPGNAIVNPYLVFVNCVFEKDTIKWSSDKPTTEDITFVAEDILGQ